LRDLDKNSPGAAATKWVALRLTRQRFDSLALAQFDGAVRSV
jgi:hypothetical protein